MPLHFASPSSSSSPSKTVTTRRLPPLNIMRSLSLCRKSRPTCTLSLAHVSACKLPPSSEGSLDNEAMQVDTVQLDLKFVAVPMPLPPSPKTLRRTKTNTNTKTKSTTPTTTTIPNDINVIPFPTSAQTNDPTTATRGSASPAGSISHTSSFKRQEFRKKEDLEHPSTTTPSSVSPPRKRARMGSLTPSSSRGTPSPRARALAQRVPPARPPTPTPDSRSTTTTSLGDEMETHDDNIKCSVQSSSVDLEVDVQSSTTESTDPCHQLTSQGEQGQDLDKHGHTELPPYSPSPPPYSPSVVAPMPITSPTPIPLHAPIPLVSPSNSSSPTSTTTTITTTPASPTPRSPPPPPPPSPQRKPRISPSELRFFILLYRTLVSGLEIRRRSRPNTQVRRARDWSRREQHLDGVLIEVDADEVDDAIAAAIDDNELTPSLNEDLEVQDALLALRLRGFLKWNGVDEWLLKVDPPSPFLEDAVTRPVSPDGMDVDASNQPPILSSRHLITVLRMRGTCGSRQGPGLGIKNRREKSKLSFCCFQAED